MSEVKAVAKTMDIKEFKKRFTKDGQGYKDNMTMKTYFCPHDLGFKITQDDCLEVRHCEECWNESMEYLNFRANQRKLVCSK